MITGKKTKKEPVDQVGCRVDAELKRELEAIAAQEERTVAQVARTAIKQYVERRKAQQAA